MSQGEKNASKQLIHKEQQRQMVPGNEPLFKFNNKNIKKGV